MKVGSTNYYLSLALVTFCFSTEMRQKYDQGEDPLDPENGQGGGGGGHPFRHGGHTFHFPGCPLFLSIIKYLFYILRWSSVWRGAVQVPLQLAKFLNDSFIASWM